MEIDTELIIKQYDANQQNYKRLENTVQSLLVKLINKHGIKTHSITPRIKEIGSFLDKIRRKQEDNKINDTETNIFDYMSLHLKAHLKSTSEPYSEEINKIPFEIQVRTIAQDAWASISHYLDYKKASSIPKQLKRDFHALSGLFYVADTHFSFLKQAQSNILFEKEIK